MESLRKALERLPDPPRRGISGSNLFFGGVVLMLAAALIFAWLWSRQAEERAIRSLPEGERKALYQRTLEDLESVCTPKRAIDLAEHCQRQAAFIVQFPECDAGCAKLARRQRATPTR